MENYFEKRFGANYINYEGKQVFLLKSNIFKRYTDLFISADRRRAELVTVVNGMPRAYKLSPNATINDILKTQRNTSLYDHINENYSYLLEMELRDCMPCSGCFYKRDKMSILASICMDNHLMELASKRNEPMVDDNIERYIRQKYETLGRYYFMEKQGLITVTAN